MLVQETKRNKELGKNHVLSNLTEMTGNCGILRAQGGPRGEVLSPDHITGVVGQESLCGNPSQGQMVRVEEPECT